MLRVCIWVRLASSTPLLGKSSWSALLCNTATGPKSVIGFENFRLASQTMVYGSGWTIEVSVRRWGTHLLTHITRGKELD